jgi:hypothetical protein
MTARASELAWQGYEPVAVVNQEPDALAAGHKLVFEERYDDLDILRESIFDGPSKATFALVRHAHAPRGGTQLLVKARSLSQATELLAEAVEMLDLTMADLIWIRQELWAGMSATTEKRAAERAELEARESASRAKGRKRSASGEPAAALSPLRHPDAALSKIVGSGAMSRQEVTKKIWAYIKRKGLQDKQNRRMINADGALRPVFGKAQINMADLPALLDKHLKSKRG